MNLGAQVKRSEEADLRRTCLRQTQNPVHISMVAMHQELAVTAAECQPTKP